MRLCRKESRPPGRGVLALTGTAMAAAGDQPPRPAAAGHRPGTTGLQRRCRVNAVKTKEADLRAVIDDLRRQQVTTIDGYVLADDRSLAFKGLLSCLAAHARRAVATPEAEVLKDEWDLVLFGHRGSVDFTGISQGWLRETAKRWAADDLPRRRIRADRITSGGGAIRHHVSCLVRLSQALRMRPDRGEHPAALGRADMEAFMHRLAYLESAGQITGDARLRASVGSGTCSPRPRRADPPWRSRRQPGGDCHQARRCPLCQTQ
jgi:hypothetical protein